MNIINPFFISSSEPLIPHKLHNKKKPPKANRDIQEYCTGTKVKIYHSGRKFTILKEGNLPESSRRIAFVAQVPSALPKDSFGNVHKEKIEQTIGKLWQESRHNDEGQVQCALSVIVVYNTPKSLNREYNRKAKEYFAACQVYNSLKTIALTFFDRPWQIDSEKMQHLQKSDFFLSLSEEEKAALKSYKLSKYQRAKVFYEILKRYGHESEANALLGLETASKIEALSYQHFREIARVWTQGATITQNLRTNGADHVYVYITDPDTLSFLTPSGAGVLDAMTRVIKQKNLQNQSIDVLSGGYRLSSKMNKIYKLAIDLDMRVRKVVARNFGLGIYYPEPSLAIKIKDSHLTLEESFLNQATDGNELGLESRRILRHMFFRSRKDYLASCTDFNPSYSIVTQMPARFTSDSAQEAQRLLDSRTQNIFAKKVLKPLRSISQSHANPRDFSANLLLGFQKTDYQNRPRGYQQKLTGIISRIMNKIDPISILSQGTTEPFTNTSVYRPEHGKKILQDSYDTYIRAICDLAGIDTNLPQANLSEKQAIYAQIQAEIIQRELVALSEFFTEEVSKKICKTIIAVCFEIKDFLLEYSEKTT